MYQRLDRAGEGARYYTGLGLVVLLQGADPIRWSYHNRRNPAIRHKLLERWDVAFLHLRPARQLVVDHLFQLFKLTSAGFRGS